MRRKGVIIGVVSVCAALLLVGGYLYHRLNAAVATVREAVLAEAESESVTVAGLAASVIGQQVMSDLDLTPHQQERIAQLYEQDRHALRDAQTQDSTSDALRERAQFKRRALRDSVRAVLTEEQWKGVEAGRSAFSVLHHDWRAYARTPLAQDLLVRLNLTAAQKREMETLAREYSPRLAALLVESDPAARRLRAEGLFDEAWARARLVLSPEQQRTVERYLVTHRREVESGLRGLWLQGL